MSQATAAAIDSVLEAAASAEVYLRTGTVLRSSGEVAIASGINLRPNELAFVEDPAGRMLAATCAGAQGATASLAMLDRGTIAPGARVVGSGRLASAPAGTSLLGRVLDGLGRPLDGGPKLHAVRSVPVFAEPPHPLAREPIHASLASGVRAIDGFLTLGRGQRVGIFAGSGVGKSTLLGMLARGTAADVTVIALIGERGREVRDFIEHDLGLDALKNCVVVTSTGDNPAAMRLCAARTATAVAEAFRAGRAGCVAALRQPHARRDGAARDRARVGRTADHARLSAFGVQPASAPDGARRPCGSREHHGDLHRSR